MSGILCRWPQPRDGAYIRIATLKSRIRRQFNAASPFSTELDMGRRVDPMVGLGWSDGVHSPLVKNAI